MQARDSKETVKAVVPAPMAAAVIALFDLILAAGLAVFVSGLGGLVAIAALTLAISRRAKAQAQ